MKNISILILILVSLTSLFTFASCQKAKRCKEKLDYGYSVEVAKNYK